MIFVFLLGEVCLHKAQNLFKKKYMGRTICFSNLQVPFLGEPTQVEIYQWDKEPNLSIKYSNEHFPPPASLGLDLQLQGVERSTKHGT